MGSADSFFELTELELSFILYIILDFISSFLLASRIFLIKLELNSSEEILLILYELFEV